MVIKLDDTPGITKKEVQTTRQTQQTTQPQPAKEQYNTSHGPIAQVIPGEQGRPDVVIYVIPENERIQGTQVSIPDPQGHLDAFGKPVPGSKSAAPTVEEQKTITRYVQDSTVPANIDKNKLTNPLPQEQFKPTGQKVVLRDLPQGGDFAATREYLLTLPNGTQVQVGDSKNDNVYVYNGGLAGQLDDDPELDYYTGYGGVTAGMAIEARQRYAAQRAASGPYSGKNVVPVVSSGVMGEMIKSRETEPYTPTVGDRIRAFVGNEQVDVKGVKLDPVMSKLVTGTYEANVWAGQKTEEFANFLGPKGSLRNELGMMIGWTASTPIGLAQFGADALALNEVYKKSPVSAVLQVQENWGVNTKAFEQTYQEHPRATGTMFMLGALVGAESALARPGAMSPKVSPKTNSIKSAVGDISKSVNNKVSPPKYGSRLSGERPHTPFETVKDLTEVSNRLRREDNIWKFEESQQSQYKDVWNLEKLKDSDVKVSVENGGSKSQSVKRSTDWNKVKSILDERNARAKSQAKASFIKDDRGSVQLLMERPKLRQANVDDMIYNSASRQKVTPRTIVIGKGLSGMLLPGTMSSMITGAKTTVKAKPKMIIGPSSFQRYSSNDISINSIIGGTKSGSGYSPFAGTYSGTKVSPSQKSKTQTKTDTALALGLGLGVGAGLGVYSASKMFAPGRMKGIGGDGSSYRRMFGSGMSREKYFTGDITSLINGKKKRRAKRR